MEKTDTCFDDGWLLSITSLHIVFLKPSIDVIIFDIISIITYAWYYSLYMHILHCFVNKRRHMSHSNTTPFIICLTSVFARKQTMQWSGPGGHTSWYLFMTLMMLQRDTCITAAFSPFSSVFSPFSFSPFFLSFTLHILKNWRHKCFVETQTRVAFN